MGVPLVARRAGACPIYLGAWRGRALGLTYRPDVGDGRESGYHHGQSDVVRARLLCAVDGGVLSLFDRPGPPKTTRGVSPTYFVPWKVGSALLCELRALIFCPSGQSPVAEQA